MVEFPKSIATNLNDMEFRYNWLIQGDRNTGFFHSSTLVRRKRNRITCLLDGQGNWVHNEADVTVLIREGFIDLFNTNAMSSPRKVGDFPFWNCHISTKDRTRLAADLTFMEVKEGLFSLKPLKAPGPDGLHAGFFQSYWHIVSNAFFEEVSKIFLTGIIPPHLNETLITLMPKCQGADCLGAFRPISLCNTIYKVVTKIIVMRLRPLLPSLISPLQTAFVPGRMGLDNMIIS